MNIVHRDMLTRVNTGSVGSAGTYGLLVSGRPTKPASVACTSK
jgi:hypothetical protein